MLAKLAPKVRKVHPAKAPRRHKARTSVGLSKKEVHALLVAERKTARQKHKASALTNKTRNIFKGQQKRAADLKRLAEIDYTLEEIRETVSDLDTMLCWYCDGPVTVKNFTMDHRIPVSRPGGTFALSNLAVCCKPCNYQKGTLTDRQFKLLLRFIAKLGAEVEQDIKRRLTIGGKFSPGRR